MKKMKAFIHYHVMFALEIPSLLFSYVLAKRKYRGKSLWLITERGTDARDNGMHLFRYIREKYPDIQVYYAITKGSADLENVERLGQVTYWGSLQHKMIYCASSVLINTHVTSKPCPFPYYDTAFRHRGLFKHKKYIGIKHGIDKDDVPIWHKEKAKLDLIICGARPEYDSERNTFHYQPYEIQYTGFPRFDALLQPPAAPKKLLLIMPTWRAYLRNTGAETFRESVFFIHWMRLLNHRKLRELSEKYRYKIVFYLHPEFQKFQSLFTPENPDMIIADEKQYDLQALLKQASLLVTDYSSVFFDFAYMEKPLCYYHFDYAEFRKKHYQEGYFDYNTMGFGPVCVNENEVIGFIEGMFKTNCVMESTYRKMVGYHFPLRDTHNCERVYHAIVNTL